MMQLMNMAGVVARPNCATLTPWLAMPASMEASSKGPDSRESRPICIIVDCIAVCYCCRFGMVCVIVWA